MAAMGQRANLLIVTGGSYEMYYTHHRANTLDHDLFWGPDYALGFIRAQRRVDPSEWLDDVWAEGGAVMDLDRRSLLWFGGEDVMCDVPYRRMHQRLMADVWAGWQVRWASTGILELAEHVGRPLSSAQSRAAEPPPAVDLGPGNEPDLCQTIGTVRLSSGDTRVSLIAADFEDILAAGSAAAAAIGTVPWPSTLDLDWTADGCRQTSGFHFDVAAREVDCWMAEPVDVNRWARDRWPGWTLTAHRDRFESQLERTAGHLRVSLPDGGSLVRRLRASMLRPAEHDRPSGAELIVAFADRLGEQAGGSAVHINAAALYDARLSVPLAVRTRLFDAAVAATTGEQT